MAERLVATEEQEDVMDMIVKLDMDQRPICTNWCLLTEVVSRGRNVVLSMQEALISIRSYMKFHRHSNIASRPSFGGVVSRFREIIYHRIHCQ